MVYRDKNGGFKSIDELAKVKGFGKACVAKVKDQFVVAPAAVAPEKSAVK